VITFHRKKRSKAGGTRKEAVTELTQNTKEAFESQGARRYMLFSLWRRGFSGRNALEADLVGGFGSERGRPGAVICERREQKGEMKIIISSTHTMRSALLLFELSLIMASERSHKRALPQPKMTLAPPQYRNEPFKVTKSNEVALLFHFHVLNS
jgi:hypothetical protein